MGVIDTLGPPQSDLYRFAGTDTAARRAAMTDISREQSALAVPGETDQGSAGSTEQVRPGVKVPDQPEILDIRQWARTQKWWTPKIASQRKLPTKLVGMIQQQYESYVARQKYSADYALRRAGLEQRISASRGKPPTEVQRLAGDSAKYARSRYPNNPALANQLHRTGRDPFARPEPSGADRMASMRADAMAQAGRENPDNALGAVAAYSKANTRPPVQRGVLTNSAVGSALQGEPFMDAEGNNIGLPGLLDALKNNPVMGWVKLRQWYQLREPLMDDNQKQQIQKLLAMRTPTMQERVAAFEQENGPPPTDQQQRLAYYREFVKMLTPEEAAQMNAK